MIVSSDILRKELLGLMAQVDAQIREIEKTAETKGVKPEQIRDAVGNWSMIPLLSAKITALSTLVQLNQNDRTRHTSLSRKKES
jgi:hypothetical protein